MKKLAIMLALLTIIGAAPGWCLVATVDNVIDGHTKNSSLTPVHDAGEMYGVVNHQIGTSFDKVPVIKERSVVMKPLDHLMEQTIHAGKSIVNGVWDLVTLRSLREKK